MRNSLNTFENSSNWISRLPTLGAGLGFREPIKGQLFLNRHAADFLEITADHFFDPSPAKAAELELLAGHFTLIPHGLNLSLGSADGLDERYLERFAKLVQRVKPPWWSEHIAFTRAGGVEIGHLAPLPFTSEAIDTLCKNIAHAKSVIGPNLILENITFNLRLPGAEMSEPEFVTKVLESSDCGMLLDVANLHINSVNHGYDPLTFLDGLPLDRIVQLHFVGEEEAPGQLIDSHCHATTPPIWALFEEVIKRAPVKGVILERDDQFPPFAELATEMAQARAILNRHRPAESIIGFAA